MTQLGGAARLAQEAVDVLALADDHRPRDLEGDDAIELRVAGLPHDPHAALAQRCDQLEAAEPAAFTRGAGDGRPILDAEGAIAGRAAHLGAGRDEAALDRVATLRAEDGHGGRLVRGRGMSEL